jgi:dipeptide/tripeptide permease
MFHTVAQLTKTRSIYLIGESLLLATSALASTMITAKTIGFAVAMVLISVGVGGTKPNLSALLGTLILFPRLPSVHLI